MKNTERFVVPAKKIISYSFFPENNFFSKQIFNTFMMLSSRQFACVRCYPEYFTYN